MDSIDTIDTIRKMGGMDKYVQLADGTSLRYRATYVTEFDIIEIGIGRYRGQDRYGGDSFRHGKLIYDCHNQAFVLGSGRGTEQYVGNLFGLPVRPWTRDMINPFVRGVPEY